MFVTKATTQDISDICTIYDQAKTYFFEHQIDQWQDGYPNQQSLIEDIQKENSYKLMNDGHLVGTAYIAVEDEPTYHEIIGQWLTKNEPYVVIHRIALDPNFKGRSAASQFVKYAISLAKNNQCGSIRIDTHLDNQSMRHFLKKNGFSECGIIHLLDGAKRIAYERVI
ncbi:MAG: GNAT family N-acetyltransferase [Erysipelotrichaceae bacterium]|nr:GNAT family N-acetyltransferase [Erysipelotrichaceae bacterium]